MLLMGANPLLGPLEGWALKISTFLGPALPVAFKMDLPASKFLCHIKNRYINS